jgi:hypothetical protein
LSCGWTLFLATSASTSCRYSNVDFVIESKLTLSSPESDHFHFSHTQTYLFMLLLSFEMGKASLFNRLAVLTRSRNISSCMQITSFSFLYVFHVTKNKP